MKYLKICPIFTRYRKRQSLSFLKTLLTNFSHPSSLKTKLGWQTFIEPLPVHGGWPSGWSFLCDILLRLPLSIFLKVVNITYQIDGLEVYLKHPIKQYVLLKHLPMDLRQGLIYARKYIFSVHEIVSNMVYLGLAQFGPHSLKVTRKASRFFNFFWIY